MHNRSVSQSQATDQKAASEKHMEVKLNETEGVIYLK